VSSYFIKTRSELARRIKTRRLQLGWSQEELADRAAIDRTCASQIERSVANPSLEVLCRVSVVLEIALEDLLSQTRDK